MRTGSSVFDKTMGCFEESHRRQASIHIKEAFYKSLDQRSYIPLQEAFTCPSHQYFWKSRQDFQPHTVGNGLSQLEDWLTYKPVEWMLTVASRCCQAFCCFLHLPTHALPFFLLHSNCFPRLVFICCPCHSSSTLNLKETQCLSTTLPCILVRSLHFPLKVESEYQKDIEGI